MFGFGQKIKNITVDELVRFESQTIIDVREQIEFRQGHIPNAKNIPMFGLVMNAEQFLNKEKTYYIICQSGNRSRETCRSLAKQGYDVVNVLGGTNEYMQKYGKK